MGNATIWVPENIFSRLHPNQQIQLHEIFDESLKNAHVALGLCIPNADFKPLTGDNSETTLVEVRSDPPPTLSTLVLCEEISMQIKRSGMGRYPWGQSVIIQVTDFDGQHTSVRTFSVFTRAATLPGK